MTEVTRTLSLKRTEHNKRRRPIAHSELWAWADETLQRNRVHVIGVRGPLTEHICRSIESFVQALEVNGWLSLNCNYTLPYVPFEHQLSSHLFELNCRLKRSTICCFNQGLKAKQFIAAVVCRDWDN